VSVMAKEIEQSARDSAYGFIARPLTAAGRRLRA
jgi:hypothetical protein